MRIKSGVGLVMIIFLMTFVFASFQNGTPSHSIVTQYSPSEKISGWINISLVNEPANSVLSSSTGQNINIIDFLDSNVADYSCMPTDCLNNYKAVNESTSKQASLAKD